MEITFAIQPAARGTQVLPLTLPLDVEIGGRRFRVSHQNRAFVALNTWILEAVADGRISRIELTENRRYRIVCRPECIRELGQKLDDLVPRAGGRAPQGNAESGQSKRPYSPRRPILRLR